MAEDVQNDPYAVSLAFEDWLKKTEDDFTAKISSLVQVGTKTNPDGSSEPAFTVESKPDPRAIPICNETGGRYLVHHLRYYFNKHIVFGDLKPDEIPKIVTAAIGEPIRTMMWNPSEYGVKDISKLRAEGGALWDSLYTFLTTIKDGNFRKYMGGIVVAQYKPNQPQAQQPNLSLYQSNTGNTQ